MSRFAYPLRPFLPADTAILREIFAAAIEELTSDDYTEEQRIAWASVAEDGAEFARRLGAMTTIVVEVDGDHLGFASLKDNAVVEMLYVHPHYAGEGIGTALMDALELIARSRGAKALEADVSDTAVPFFEKRGWVKVHRNLIARDEEWLANTYMRKPLEAERDEGQA